MFYDKYNSSWFSWFPSIWRKDNKSKIDDIKQAAFGFGDSVFHEEKVGGIDINIIFMVQFL